MLESLVDADAGIINREIFVSNEIDVSFFF